LIAAFGRELAGAPTVLEIAPSPVVTNMLRSGAAVTYVGTDLDPSADGRAVNVVADLCSMPFRSGAFHIIVCFHVLEHIPSDRDAIRELARVLAPEGLVFLQVPWRPGRPTEEDPGADAEERLRRFGQADHVRWYGDDFEDRLRENGLRPVRVRAPDFLPEEVMAATATLDYTPIWLVVRENAAWGARNDESILQELRQRIPRPLLAGWQAALAAVMTTPSGPELKKLQSDLVSARRAAAHWERSYRGLRNRLPIRAAARIREAWRRLPWRSAAQDRR
jgi:SAM-dependent methyltransferase